MKFFPAPLFVCLAMATLSSCNQLASVPGRVLSLPGALLNVPGKLLGKNDAKKKQALEALAKADAKETADRMGAAAVGEVSYVDEESGFILIKRNNARVIPPSTPLLAKTLTGTITARLTASPAARGSFLAADIVSGTPERGNPILVDPAAKPTKDAPPQITPMAGSPAEPASAAVPAGTHAPARVAPKLEPILPPLEPLNEPVEAPELPKLDQ